VWAKFFFFCETFIGVDVARGYGLCWEDVSSKFCLFLGEVCLQYVGELLMLLCRV
jgi:hypothetical protein